MAFSQWWSLTAGMVSSDRDEAGVYQLANSSGTIIYVGSSDKIKTRMTAHVNEQDNDCIKKNATQYRTEYTSSYKAREKELYNEYVAANGKAPQCNKVAPTG